MDGIRDNGRDGDFQAYPFMIRLVIRRAREHEWEDGQWFDTQTTLEERMTLRDMVTSWQACPEAKNYPLIQIFRDDQYISDMLAYMEFETEEQACLFKLTHLELFQV